MRSRQYLAKSLSLSSAILVALTWVVVSSAPAGATNTAGQCDSVPKYYCTYINYTSATYITINARYWEGAIDGGAYRWRLDYAIDYWWDVGSSSWQRGYDATGPSAYRTNVQFDGFTCGGCVSYGYNTPAVRVDMLIRFDECAPSCYAWYSPVMRHNAS